MGRGKTRNGEKHASKDVGRIHGSRSFPIAFRLPGPDSVGRYVVGRLAKDVGSRSRNRLVVGAGKDASSRSRSRNRLAAGKDTSGRSGKTRLAIAGICKQIAGGRSKSRLAAAGIDKNAVGRSRSRVAVGKDASSRSRSRLAAAGIGKQIAGGRSSGSRLAAGARKDASRRRLATAGVGKDASGKSRNRLTAGAGKYTSRLAVGIAKHVDRLRSTVACRIDVERIGVRRIRPRRIGFGTTYDGWVGDQAVVHPAIPSTRQVGIEVAVVYDTTSAVVHPLWEEEVWVAHDISGIERTIEPITESLFVFGPSISMVQKPDRKGHIFESSTRCTREDVDSIG